MANEKRIKGLWESLNFEVGTRAPLDSRRLAKSIENITSEEWWNGAALYDGLDVIVLNNGTPNLYVLVDKEKYQQINSWVNIAGLGGGGGEGVVYDFNEDDFKSQGVNVSLASYTSSPASYKSFGHIILRPNPDLYGNNILNQEDIIYSHTIYEIKYDFSLGNQTLTLPYNSCLFFNGGTLSNGTIEGTEQGTNYIFGSVSQNSRSGNFFGITNTVNVKNCYNFDGTLFSSKVSGFKSNRPTKEIDGFTFYDKTINKLIIWNSTDSKWYDVLGNEIDIENVGDLQDVVKGKVTQGYLYKDTTDYWKTNVNSTTGRWMIRNEQGGWDAIPTTDRVTAVLDGLMASEDKVFIEDLKNKIPTIESEIASLRADLIGVDTFLVNSTFNDLLNGWETLELGDEKKFFTYGIGGLFLQVDSKSLSSILSNHHGATYAIRRDGRCTVCIENNFLRQLETYYIAPPTMEQLVNGVYEPFSCLLNFYFFVEEDGVITIEFENEDNLYPQETKVFNKLYYKGNLYKSSGWELFRKEFEWSGYGNFKISFTGKIYIHTISCYKDNVITVERRYDKIEGKLDGVTSRFHNFDDRSSEELLNEIVNTDLRPIEDVEEVVFCTKLGIFVGVYYEGDNAIPHYCTTWDKSDLYNYSDRSGILSDKIYIMGNDLYIQDNEVDSLGNPLHEDTYKKLIKYSSDNNDHVLCVDKKGFYVLDSKGLVGLSVTDEGTKFIGLDNMVCIPADVYNQLITRLERLEEQNS